MGPIYLGPIWGPFIVWGPFGAHFGYPFGPIWAYFGLFWSQCSQSERHDILLGTTGPADVGLAMSIGN